jgi:hypothetical protein
MFSLCIKTINAATATAVVIRGRREVDQLSLRVRKNADTGKDAAATIDPSDT